MEIIVPKHSADPRVAKIIGFDTELMNVNSQRDDSGFSASRALLREVRGCSANVYTSVQDSGRKFLPGSGGSIYIDLDHLELAGPECRSAHDFMKSFHGMLGFARQAAKDANEDREAPLRVHANNTDGMDHSWGGHLSVLLSRTAYDWIFSERLHYLLWLASAQASSIILTGAGKLGTENGRAAVPYSISQRADFFECISSIETTRHRPLVNTRDEGLGGHEIARLHCIFHDTTLCHTSLVMRAFLMQAFTALIEAELVDLSLCFEEPLAAVRAFSADPTLRAKARLTDGRWVTAVEHQVLLRENAERLLENDGEGSVPGLNQHLAMWSRLLDALGNDERDYLASRIDWVGKLGVLERAASNRGMDFSNPAMKALDFAWSELENGIYFQFERAGAVERLATEAEIIHAANEAPEDTRAYPRSRLIRAFGGRPGVSIDWHKLVVGSGNQQRAVVNLPDPGAGHQVYGDLDGLSDRDLLDRIGVQVVPQMLSWTVVPPGSQLTGNS